MKGRGKSEKKKNKAKERSRLEFKNLKRNFKKEISRREMIGSSSSVSQKIFL